MLTSGLDRDGRGILLFGKDLPRAETFDESDQRGTYKQANPAAIQKALDQALKLPAFGWYVLDASRRIGDKPKGYIVDSRELVAWRCDGALAVARNACPHMGAPLSAGRVCDGEVVCPWHGLRLGKTSGREKSMLRSYDDGILSWVCLQEGDEKTEHDPVLTPRPDLPIDGVIRMIARCEPSDVIANRLDPWHGSWFHYHTFARLKVLGETGDAIRVRVAFRVFKRLCVEVDCSFHCPDPRTIVMTIVDGEGVGSVVETHATPIVPGFTAIIEATLADSERIGFKVAKRLTPLIRPFIERNARRLWVEDAAYAERKYALRQEGQKAFVEDGDWYAIVGTPRRGNR
ncbi:MAG: Rieske 2Fe-2S domain-containing protein [Deltaproteobacteria bacterium]|nr:Rieske 2Fe-2S domain-containing protein [Deltaproteobacteria bacterium]